MSMPQTTPFVFVWKYSWALTFWAWLWLKVLCPTRHKIGHFRDVLSCPVLSCLSVTFMYCGQTAGWIKMKLGMLLGFGSGHIVLDGDPAPLHQRGTPPIFGPYMLWSNGCTDQDDTWYGGRPRPRRLCIRWGPRSPSPKRGGASSPIFGPCIYCGQTAGWIKIVLCMEVGLSPGDFVLDRDPTPFLKNWAEPLPIFGPFLLWQNGWMHQDAIW